MKRRSTVNTITQLQEKFGGADLDHLEAFGDVEVPVITGMQHQGDLFVVPMRMGKVEGLVDVPKEGVAVIRGEAGGNTHLLIAEGDVKYARTSQREGVHLGTLFVGEGSIAWLHHLEHGYNGIGAGLYSLRGKRTQMDEIRRVAD
jgi:hypothetical protein